ncbi:hypothetical protein ACXZ1M_12345 [Duganella sp. PWIR1]
MVESEGIPAFLAGEHHIWASWPISLALGGVKLQVPIQYVSEALAVLERRNSGEFEAVLLEQVPFNAAVCSVCGSTEFYATLRWSSIVLAMTFLFVGNAIFPPIKEKKCVACRGAEKADL